MRILSAAFLLILLAACGEAPLPPAAETGRLVVALRHDASAGLSIADGAAYALGRDLAARFAEELGIEAQFIPLREREEIAALLDKGRAHMAIAVAARFDAGANIRWLPLVAAAVPGSRAPAWAFANRGADDLAGRARAFVERARRDGRLERLIDRHIGHAGRLSEDAVGQFIGKVQSDLPHYRRDFVEAQALSGIDWRLLAALAYQESHWDPLATSWTNVRGMMMLTEDTADRLGVKNRLDARQSILAGARYLAELRDQLPAEVPEPDRLWLAVAAYNLGMGHMNGARFIATLVKRDPDSWYEMKQVLPLLSKPEYHSRLKSGAARGGEAVIMTENVRNYYDILQRHEKADAPPQALSMSSSPPMYGRSATGTSTQPSAR